MGLADNTETYPVEQRGFSGTDKRRDRSLITADFFSDSSNLTLEEGVVKARLGSTRWGTLSFAAVVGTRRSFHTIDVGTVDFVLVHIGTKLYRGLKTDLTPTAIQTLSAVDVAVTDAESEFLDYGMDFSSGGQRVLKVLFKQAAGCKILEYSEATAAWTARTPSLDLSTLSRLFVGEAGFYSGPPIAEGTYRVRLIALRVINGVRLLESAVFAEDFDGVKRPYGAVTVGVGNGITVVVEGTAPPPGATHWMIQCTRELALVGGSSYSNNGNDPTVFYETPLVAISATFAADGSQAWEVDASNMAVTCLDTQYFLPLPGHLISCYSGGVVFFGGVNLAKSRIYRAGGLGFIYHNEMYNPASFYAAEESDGKDLTALAIVGDHLGVWKENKTGIVPNCEPDVKVIWRDKKIGTLYRKAVAATSEDQIIVLCHDGLLRIFDGSAYSSRKRLEDGEKDLSNKVRSITESIDAATVSFIWHREKLHLLYGASGSRKALVLHPGDGFGWMPWTSLQHEWNSLVDNENSWIYLSTTDSLLYEQSPTTETYLDRGSVVVAWNCWFAPVFPKNRKNKIQLLQWLVEAYFQYLFTGYFKVDGGRLITADARGIPDPSLAEFVYFQYFKLHSTVSVFGLFFEAYLAGEGKVILRSNQSQVKETALLGTGYTSVAGHEQYDYLPIWIGQCVLHLRFDEDVATAYDYSGNNRDHVYSAGTGGTRTFDATLIPGGGQSLVAGTDSGYFDADWDGLDYIGDDDGYNSSPLVFEYVASFPTLASAQTIHQGGDGTDYWRLQINTDGSLQFDIQTDALAYSFTTAAGVIVAGATQYTIQFILSNGGMNGQFYAAPRTGSMAANLTTRSAL